MIMDDLTVRPTSTISSITSLNKFNVKDVAVLEEKVIDMGMDEVKDALSLAIAHVLHFSVLVDCNYG